MTWFLRFLFFTSCFLSIVLSQSIDQLAILELSVSENNCGFYQALEMMIPCGKDGYVTGFGNKYCEAYLDERDNFIDKKWQNGVRVCLQRAMLSKLWASSGASCPEIEDWGFGSHLECYMRPIPSSPEVKFCRIPGSDLAKVAWIAKGAVFEEQVRKQFATMAKECAGQYLQDVNEDFVNFLKKTMNAVGWS